MGNLERGVWVFSPKAFDGRPLRPGGHDRHGSLTGGVGIGNAIGRGPGMRRRASRLAHQGVTIMNEVRVLIGRPFNIIDHSEHSPANRQPMLGLGGDRPFGRRL